MRRNSDLKYKFFLIALDALALIGAFTAAYILRISLDPRPFHTSISALEFITSILTILPLWILLFYFFGLYSRENYTHPIREIGRLALAAICGIMLMISFSFFTNTPLFPAKLVAVYAMGISFAILLVLRSAANIVRLKLLRRGIGIKRVAIIGNCDLTYSLASFLSETPTSGFKLATIIAREQYVPPQLKNLHASSLSSALTRHKIDAVIQTDQTKADEYYNTAMEHFLEYYQAPMLEGLMMAHHSMEMLDSTPLMYIHPTPLTGYGQVAKRTMDIVGSLIGIIIASPFMLLVALAVKLGDPKGPVLMRGTMQKRLTRYNQPFNVYKFRSHYAKFDGKTDEEVFAMIGKPELIEEYRKNGDKLDHDFRVTPVGRFIRRFSLDELPQLFNVLKGDISLVGPRALVPHELSNYEKKHTLLSVKSGLTGLAVVSGRRNISFDERRRLDLYYVQNWSLWMDITIILKTCLVIFKKDS